MSLKDQIKNNIPDETNRCLLGKILGSMTDEDREAFNTVAPRIAVEPGYTYTWIRKLLADEGFNVSENVVRRHVRGTCVCR